MIRSQASRGGFAATVISAPGPDESTGDERQVEAVLAQKLFKRADRLFAVCRVVIDQRDFLALANRPLAIRVVDRRQRHHSSSCGIVKDMAEHFTVCCRSTTVTHGVDRDAISSCFRDQLVSDSSGKRLINQSAFALCGLVALNAFFSVIACFAFQNSRWNTTDTAITLVQ